MKERNGEHPFGDAGQMILLGLFLAVWGLDSFLIRKTTFLASYLPLSIRLALLAAALVVAFWMVRTSHFVVSNEVRPHHVITTGAFRYVRHPLYLASLLTYFGMAVSTASLVSLALLIGISLFYNYIAGYEEALLEVKFGNDYRLYKTTTGKWIPHFGARR